MTQWPEKTREVRNHHMDSSLWNNVAFRDDDIVIASYAKSGTTWVQQIVGQLIFAGDEAFSLQDASPLVEMRAWPEAAMLAEIEAQQHRRFLKTHLPVDTLVFSPQARYLYVARDGRDVVWRMYNHHVNATEDWYRILNETPGLVGPPLGPPPESVVEYFRDWLDRDGYPFWPFWHHVKSWWDARHLPNVLLCHFAELKADLPGSIRRIADFLAIEVDPARWDDIVHHCSFEFMKQNADRSAPAQGAYWKGGAQTFINRGTNERLKSALTPHDVERYEAAARAELGQDCARWLATGRAEQDQAATCPA
jgi:aryl sulfotransferase